jgi:hypothetical protein
VIDEDPVVLLFSLLLYSIFHRVRASSSETVADCWNRRPIERASTKDFTAFVELFEIVHLG